ncbi:MAG: hypothetical protein KF764_33265 [Labilithrix sp.]|nr:hypothetical protein [Labilithrix sp.]MBX3222802.1 hypothetical protein [Labilithrix sp.]
MTSAQRTLLASVLSSLAACGSPAPPPIVAVPPVAVDVAPSGTGQPAASAEPPEAPSAPEAPPTLSETALQEWSRQTQCADFDYFPNGGIQNFWCHRPSRVTLAAVRALAGVNVFSSGPHKEDDLTLDAKNAFGHYNPAFVRWLVDNASPSPRDSAARKATQPSYDAHLKPLAEVFWRTLEKARREQGCFDREKNAYAAAIARRALPKDYYERWFFFMNPFYCDKARAGDRFFYDNALDGGVNGNVTKSVIGFWMRRSLDGTMDTFAEGLKKVIASYQPELLDGRDPAPDPAALSRALDAGVKRAAACKDATAKQPNAYVTVTVAPDGQVSAQVGTAHAGHGSPQAMCIAAAFAAERVARFDGAALRFTRSVPLK